MSIGTAYTREGSIDWGGVPGSRGTGKQWLGFTASLIPVVVLTPTVRRAAVRKQPGPRGRQACFQGRSRA